MNSVQRYIYYKEINSYLVNSVERSRIVSQVVVGHCSIRLLPALHFFDVDDVVIEVLAVVVDYNIEPIEDGNLGCVWEHYSNVAADTIILYHQGDILNDEAVKMK